MRRGCLSIALATLVLGIAPSAGAETRALEQVSTGPLAGPAQPYDASYDGATPDGSHIFFRTAEPLVAEDQDTGDDLYMRAGGVTTLISPGDGGTGASFQAVNEDGTKVVFATTQPISAGDTDTTPDLYLWQAGTYTELTDGPAVSDPAYDVGYVGSTPSLSHVYFTSPENITGDESDGTASDIFDWSSGAATRVSKGPSGHDSNTDTFGFLGAAADGSVAYFESFDSLSVSDTDANDDVYSHAAGSDTSTIVSDDASDANTDVLGLATAEDGQSTLFVTPEALLPADVDSRNDIYRASPSGALTLMTPNTANDTGFAAATPDLARVAFTTDEQLDPVHDTDAEDDVYVADGGNYTLATAGTADPVTFQLASQDLSRIFAGTVASLAPADGDGGAPDTYEWNAGTPTLITTGPADAQSPSGTASLDNVSDDGTRAFFSTTERLTSDDNDGGLDDSYERVGGETHLLAPGSNASIAEAEDISEDGRVAYVSAADPLTASDTDGGGDDVFASTIGAPAVETQTQAQTQTPSAPPNPGPVVHTIRSPLLKLATPKRQRLLKQRGIFVTLTSDEDATATLRATVNVPRAAKVFRFKSAKRALRANVPSRVKLLLGKKALKRAGQALKRGGKLKAKVTVTAVDVEGNPTSKRLTIALRR